MKILSIVLVISLVLAQVAGSQPSAVGEGEGSQAMLDAHKDVQSEDMRMWIASGCCLGVWGIAFAYFATPIPPAHRLIGKSPEYVQVYTLTYQRKMQQERVKASAGGCVFSTLTVGTVYLLGIAAAVGELWEF